MHYFCHYCHEHGILGSSKKNRKWNVSVDDTYFRNFIYIPPGKEASPAISFTLTEAILFSNGSRRWNAGTNLREGENSCDLCFSSVVFCVCRHYFPGCCGITHHHNVNMFESLPVSSFLFFQNMCISKREKDICLEPFSSWTNSIIFSQMRSCAIQIVVNIKDHICD